jgi:hypothetical protein
MVTGDGDAVDYLAGKGGRLVDRRVDDVAAPTREQRVGRLLRDCRQRHRLSQLELALTASTSARHIIDTCSCPGFRHR